MHGVDPEFSVAPSPGLTTGTGNTEAATALLQKSLERNPTYGSAQLSLMVALSLTGRHRGAALLAESFRQQYLEAPAKRR